MKRIIEAKSENLQTKLNRKKEYIAYLRFVFNYFGEKKQWSKLAEELAETLTEIARGNRKMTIAEMVDVEVVWDQMKLFALTEKEKEFFAREKLRKTIRTYGRIKNGYYKDENEEI